MTMSALNLPIRAIALALLVTAIGCNPDDELSGWSDWGCPEIYGDGTPEQARELALEYEFSDYESLVSQHGEPIDEGYFGYDDGSHIGEPGDSRYEYIFLFNNSDPDYETHICYMIDMDGGCVTYEFNACHLDMMTIEDCEECAQHMTRIE